MSLPANPPSTPELPLSEWELPQLQAMGLALALRPTTLSGSPNATALQTHCSGETLKSRCPAAFPGHQCPDNKRMFYNPAPPPKSPCPVVPEGVYVGSEAGARTAGPPGLQPSGIRAAKQPRRLVWVLVQLLTALKMRVSYRVSVSPHHQCQGTSGPRRNTESQTPNMTPQGQLSARPVLTSRPSATVPSRAIR